MWCSAEAQPNPDSRVRLGDQLDGLGLPRIALDWRLTELDKRSLLAGHQAVAEELGRIGVGRLQIDDWLTADPTSWSPTLGGGHHHLGTTRMNIVKLSHIIHTTADDNPTTVLVIVVQNDI